MSEIRDVIKEISVERIKTHIKNLEGIRHPVYAPDALKNAAEYVWKNLQSYGLDMKGHHFIDDNKPYKNVIGLHQGAKQPDKKVIIVAHLDTVAISPGADDNASGVAAMLELGRVLKRYKFEKSILFVGANLEEDGENGLPGLRGSTALASTAKKQGWLIEGVVNFDTIAYAGEDIIQRTPDNIPVGMQGMPEVGNFIAVIGNENSGEMVKNYIGAIEQYQIPLPYFPLVIPGNGELLPDIRRSDHAPFWDIGSPAIMITNTANFRTPHYHQASDTLDTLNLPFVTEVCRAGGGLVCEMACIV